MKKFSLKFMLFATLCLFSSFVYADGVFSRYQNAKFLYAINVPLEKYEQATYEDMEITELPFIKNSNSIPSKNYFSGVGAVMGDGISIKNKKDDINILAYGTFLSYDLDEDIIKEEFKEENLNYNQFVKKYYNGKLPRNIDKLKYEYNKLLFTYGDNVAYNTIGKDFYVISFIKNDEIFYRKMMFNKKEEIYVVFEASYLPKDKKFMDKIVTEMVNSIKFLKYE